MSNFQAWETRNLVKFAQDSTVRIAELEEDLKTAIHAYRYFMKQPHAPKLRELLRNEPEGLTIRAMTDATGARMATIQNALKSMPDVYVDRWEGPYRGQWAAVYCLHSPPPDCPRPSDA